MEKKERKGNTLEATLYHIINDFINRNKGSSLDDDKVTLESARIWEIVKEELEGEEVQGRSRSYDTIEYSIISSTKIHSCCLLSSSCNLIALILFICDCDSIVWNYVTLKKQK